MSKTTKYLLVGLAALVFVLIFTVNRCGMSERSAILQGKVDELSQQNTQLLADLDQKRIDYEASTKLHNQELNRIRADAHAADIDYNDDIYKKAKELEKAEGSIVDINELVVNLRAQISVAKTTITNLETKIVAKQRAFDDLDAEWKVKEREWIDFSAGQDEVIENMKKEIVYWKNLTVSLKKDIGGLQLGGKVKTGVAIGLAVAVVYGLVAK